MRTDEDIMLTKLDVSYDSPHSESQSSDIFLDYPLPNDEVRVAQERKLNHISKRNLDRT